jgi:hypothetical protein
MVIFSGRKNFGAPTIASIDPCNWGNNWNPGEVTQYSVALCSNTAPVSSMLSGITSLAFGHWTVTRFSAVSGISTAYCGAIDMEFYGL